MGAGLPDSTTVSSAPHVDVAAARARVRTATRADVPAVRACLVASGLSTAGVGADDVRLAVLEDRQGRIVGVTGFEGGGPDALLRSVAVAPALRRHGLGRMLAEAACERAAALPDVERLWVLDAGSGAFWQRLGFRLVPTTELMAALPHAWQVVALVESGDIERQIAWTRPARP